VCAVVNIKWFDFNKEAVFCNFDLAYLPCRLHPSRIFPVTRRITRKVGYSTVMQSDVPYMRLEDMSNS